MEVRVRGDSQIMEYTVPLAKLQQPFLTSTTGNWDITSGQANYVFGATITNIPDPVNPYDVATKAYVDTKILGLAWKEPAKVKADSNVDVSTLAAGASIDGVTLEAGDRVLLTNQTTGTENGVWVVPASAPATRAADWVVGATAANYSIFISEGTYHEQAYTVSNNTGGDVIGTHTLTFIQFAGPGLLCTEVFSDCFLGTDGSAGPYNLQEDNITPNTERVYLNGVRQAVASDYNMDNAYGEVTFTFPLKNNPGQTDIVCVDYCHDELASPPGFVLTNLVHDWNAASLTGLDDGDPITEVPDDGPGGVKLEQTTAVNRPTYVSGRDTGDIEDRRPCFPGIRFDHSTNIQQLDTESAIELWPSKNGTVCMVIANRAQTTSLKQRLFNHGAEEWYMAAFGASQYPAGYADANDDILLQPDRNIGNNFTNGIYVLHLRRSGDKMKMRVSGNDEGEVTLPSDTTPVSAILEIAGFTAANTSANIDLVRMLVYDTALTDDQIQKNEIAFSNTATCYPYPPTTFPVPPDPQPPLDPSDPVYGSGNDGTYKHWIFWDWNEGSQTWPAWRGGLNLTKGSTPGNVETSDTDFAATNTWFPGFSVPRFDSIGQGAGVGLQTTAGTPWKLWNEVGGVPQGTVIIAFIVRENMFTAGSNRSFFAHSGGVSLMITWNGETFRPGLLSLSGASPQPSGEFEPWSDQPTGWWRQGNLNIIMIDRYNQTVRTSRNGYLRKTRTVTGWQNNAGQLSIGLPNGGTVNSRGFFDVAEIIVLPYSIYQRGIPTFWVAWDLWWTWLVNYYADFYFPWTVTSSQIPVNHGDDPALNLQYDGVLGGRNPPLG